jgi:nucleotide-binding universal stress UspA family protein
VAAARLVVGYDGSDESRAAVAYAVARAGRRGDVTIVHALDSALPLPGMRQVAGESLEHGDALLDALLLEDGDVLTDTGFDVRLVRAKPVDALIATAEEVGAEEIVVGARGLGRVRSVLGSTSQELIHRAPCPVVVIPCATAPPAAGTGSG